MNPSQRRQRFRAILAGTRCVHPASVHDAISARIAEDLGFELGMLGGSVAALAVLGAPDLALLTLTEFADQSHRICRAGGLPVLVDADHGFGNALSVTRTVQELEAAGVAGLTIEDTELPQAFGAGAAARLTSVDEGVGKMRAALAGRQDPSLVILGRTSAPGVSDLEDTLARVRAYSATGVDGIFLVGVRSREQLGAIAAVTELPIVLGGVPPELNDLAYLASVGVRVCLQGHLPFAAAVAAIHATLSALRQGVQPSAIGGVAPAALMKQLTRDADYARASRDFLGGDTK
jgi:carboxyvinyl-carboxyphosphonate phosphorylmutase